MTRIYDLTNLVGVAAVTSGVWMDYGRGAGLIAGGLMVVGLNLVALSVALRSR